jgi:hypothetical protein
MAPILASCKAWSTRNTWTVRFMLRPLCYTCALCFALQRTSICLTALPSEQDNATGFRPSSDDYWTTEPSSCTRVFGTYPVWTRPGYRLQANLTEASLFSSVSSSHCRIVPQNVPRPSPSKSLPIISHDRLPISFDSAIETASSNGPRINCRSCEVSNESENDCELQNVGSGRDIFEGIIPAFSRRNFLKPQQMSVSVLLLRFGPQQTSHKQVTAVQTFYCWVNGRKQWRDVLWRHFLWTSHSAPPRKRRCHIFGYKAVHFTELWSRLLACP